MNGSCNIWMGHVAYDGGMSRMNVSRHIHLSRIKQLHLLEPHFVLNYFYMFGIPLGETAFSPYILVNVFYIHRKIHLYTKEYTSIYIYIHIHRKIHVYS